ncbi:MAG: iron-containing alcohol dehydrogenase [Mesorhizobium sp.]
MQSFTFRTVAEVRREWGIARRLGEVLGTFSSSRRVLIVTDKALMRANLLAPALESLERSGFAASIYDGVQADPPESNVMEAAELAKSCRAELVVGFGGGSTLDVAKLASVLAVSTQPIEALYGIGKIQGSRLPLVQMPTTSGTGSEVTNISILSTGQSKMGIVAPQLFADLVLLDAELTIGLPRLHTAATGIDAMVHAIEAFTSRHLKNPVSDCLATAALKLLTANLLTACETPADRGAREAMLLGAMLAGQAFTNAPVAAVHALAYPLGGRYHIPHGISNALMLGPVLRFNLAAATREYAELGAAIGVTGSGEAEIAGGFIAHLSALSHRSGAPMRLRDMDVSKADLPPMAKDAMEQQRLLRNNPVEVTEADALRLYEEAY